MSEESSSRTPLLKEFCRIMLASGGGPDSPSSQAFLKEHGDDTEFLEDARLAATLYRALRRSKPPPGKTSTGTTPATTRASPD